MSFLVACAFPVDMAASRRVAATIRLRDQNRGREVWPSAKPNDRASLWSVPTWASLHTHVLPEWTDEYTWIRSKIMLSTPDGKIGLKSSPSNSGPLFWSRLSVAFRSVKHSEVMVLSAKQHALAGRLICSFQRKPLKLRGLSYFLQKNGELISQTKIPHSLIAWSDSEAGQDPCLHITVF